MQSVIVLTPHGRRQTVKVEPNKTVLSILEDVCKKFNQFDPSAYGLKHHNKILDLSQMFRFAGLPNNSTLEMVEVNKKEEQNQMLIICCQLEGGERINGEFTASATFREVITNLCPTQVKDFEFPVVIYMRSEIFGDALDTTLKSVGLCSGGRALFRLLNRDPETLKVQANISAPLPQKEKREEPEHKPLVRNAVDAPGPSKAVQISDVKRMIEEIKKSKDQEDEPMELEEEEVEQKQSQVVEKVEKIEAAPEPFEPPVMNYLDDRGTIIFSLDALKTSSIELPDSFFDLTESEVGKLHRDLKKKVEYLDNRPLMTTELRNLEESKKILNQLSMYKSTTIRIQFPNRFVIQSKFSTVESVAVVMEFVKKFLINPQCDFYFYLTPPKTILETTTTLIEAGCVPSAVLHFGCDSSPEDEEMLKPELYEKLSSGFGIAQAALVATDNVMASGSSNQSMKKPMVPSNFLQSSSKSAKSDQMVPKWFKNNGK